jgi:hypothetical protein
MLSLPETLRRFDYTIVLIQLPLMFSLLGDLLPLFYYIAFH